MSEIRIIHQHIQQSLNNSVTQSGAVDKLIDNIRVGQVLDAQLVKLENKYWLIIESVKLPISKEVVEQMGLKANQTIQMKVRSTTGPVELQIIKDNKQKPPAIQSSRLINRNQQPAPNPINPNKLPDTAINTRNEPLVPATQLEHAHKFPGQNVNHDKTLIQGKVDSDKLILEARNFLKKDLSTPKNSALGNLTSPRTDLTKEQSLRNPSKSELPLPDSDSIKGKPVKVDTGSNTKIPETLRSIITQSRLSTNVASGITTNPSSKSVEAPQIKGDAPLIKGEAPHIKGDAPLIKGDAPLIKDGAPLIKDGAPLIKGGAPLIKGGAPLIKGNIAQTQGQKLNFDSETKHIFSDNRQSKTNLRKMKLEIPVNLPDKNKFPLLSEKIDNAYQRLLPAQNTGHRSLNELFSQLQRLNQWSSDNKSAKNSSPQSDKLAADLKESLKDLFRYISKKDHLNSSKSIEKALRQSGTFLEKRINTQQESTKHKNAKFSSELTLHKDLKANLNRVLATTLYNLAKINSSTTAATASVRNPANPSNPATTGTLSGSPAQSRQLSGNTVTVNNNLIQQIRNRVNSFRGSKTSTDFMPELERITKEVLKSVQSALFRSQLGQLINLRPESSPQQWLFELPVMNNKEVDTFLVQFGEHSNQEDNESDKKGWSLVLQFNIAPLGKIRVMLMWQEDKVQLRFLAEQEKTVELVTSELEHFKNILSKQGLSLEQLTVEQALLDDINIKFSKSN